MRNNKEMDRRGKERKNVKMGRNVGREEGRKERGGREDRREEKGLRKFFSGKRKLVKSRKGIVRFILVFFFDVFWINFGFRFSL